MTPLASRIVDDALQERFAALSGDRNPMHMDPVAARRTQAGQPVVHGVHTLLWSLETLAAHGLLRQPIARIKARFLKWIYLGDAATLSIAGDEPGTMTLQIDVMQLPVIAVDILFTEPCPSRAPISAGLSSGVGSNPSTVPPLPAALDLSFAELENRSGEAFVCSDVAASTMFPALSALLGANAVAEIAACSYIVGMQAPGLHSMFSKLDVTLIPHAVGSTRHTLHYAVTYLDERFRKGRIQVDGSSIEGVLEVFVRVPPVQQASMELVARYVQPREFAGMNALIIGGSRGLGELTAKLVAAGGGSTIITYAIGRTEAESVVAAIREGGGTASAIPYDVRVNAAQQIGTLPPITHLFYFATNTIYKPKLGLLSPSTLAEFAQFYLQGFYDLCVALMASEVAARPAKLGVLYPSTVFLEDRPAGMTEYAMIKAAGEQLCIDMNRYLPGLHILCARLPKLPTDQTAGVIPERETAAIDVILPIVRELCVVPML